MRVCLVGATNVTANPRLRREADTLAAAGHQVRVVAPEGDDEWYQLDLALAREGGWRLQPVDFRPLGLLGRWRNVSVRARRKIAESFWQARSRHGPAMNAYVPALSQSIRVAASEADDWLIAHAHGALVVAAAAAARNGAALAFDLEDLLAESNCGGPVDIIRLIEDTYIPRCRYVSVTSHAMAEYLRPRFPRADLVTLYNVFPRDMARGLPPVSERAADPILRLHWVGLTVGLGRGIEDAVGALAQLGDRVHLYLRGRAQVNYADGLGRAVREAGVEDRVHLLERVPAREVVRAMGGFHVNLALQRNDNVNADITTTNKLFSGMLAGLAIAGTDTAGQREVLENAPGTGFLYPWGDTQALAAALSHWLDHPADLRTAQEASWQAAHRRYCWDEEAATFLRLLTSGPCTPESTCVAAG